MKILAILLPLYFVMELTYSNEMKRYERTSNSKNTIKYGTIKCGKGILGLSCGSLCLWNCQNYDVRNNDCPFTKYITNQNFNNAGKTSSAGNDIEDNAGIETEEKNTKKNFIHRKEFYTPPNIITLGEKFKNPIITNPTSRSNRIKQKWKRRYNRVGPFQGRLSINHAGYGNFPKELLKFKGYENRQVIINNNRFQEPMKKIEKTYKVIGWSNGIEYPNEPVRGDIGIGRLQNLPILVIASCSENDRREICNVQENSKNMNGGRKHQTQKENIQFSSKESSHESKTNSKNSDSKNNDSMRNNDSHGCNGEEKWQNVTNKLEAETISPITKESSHQEDVENKEMEIKHAEEVKEIYEKRVNNPQRLVAPDKNVITFRGTFSDVMNDTIADVTSVKNDTLFRDPLTDADVNNDTLSSVKPDKDDVIIFKDVPTDVKNDTVDNIE